MNMLEEFQIRDIIYMFSFSSGDWNSNLSDDDVSSSSESSDGSVKRFKPTRSRYVGGGGKIQTYR